MIRSKKTRKTSWRSEPAVIGVEPLGRVSLELLRRLDAQHVLQKVLERALREGLEARGGLRLAARARIELRGPRADPSVPDREVVGLPRVLRAPPVGEMGIHLEDARRRGSGRRGGSRRVEARQPPVGFVERGADRRNEARGLGKGGEQRRVVGLGLSGGRSMEVEKERRGELLALLIEAAQVPARVARGQASGQPPDALLERAGGFPGAVAIQRERERREGLVDLPALRVEEDRVLEVGARMARLVEAEKERVRAARESSRAVVRDVDPPGAGAVGFDREGPDRVREPRRRVRRRQGRRGAAPRAPRGVSRAP